MSTKTDSANALRQRKPRRGPPRIYDVSLLTKDMRCIVVLGYVRARKSHEAIAMVTRLAEERGHEIDRVRYCIRLRPGESAEVERTFADPQLRAAAFSEWEGFVRNPFLGFLGFEEVTS